MKSPNTENKSSEDLKHEVHHELNKVRRDIDQLKGRLTPGQVIDDAIFHSHGRSVAGTIDHLKSNPVGTAFLSLGTMLLMEDQNRVSYEKNARTKMQGLKQDIQTKAQSAKQEMQSKAQSLKEGLQTKTQGLKQNFSERTAELKNKFEKKKEETGSQLSYGADFEGIDQAPSRREKMREGIDKVKGQLNSSFTAGKEKIQGLDPLSYLALGAGLGALTGAALPVSEKERELIDSRFSGEFSNFGSDLQEAVNKSANMLKDLVIDDVKGFHVDIFNR